MQTYALLGPHSHHPDFNRSLQVYIGDLSSCKLGDPLRSDVPASLPSSREQPELSQAHFGSGSSCRQIDSALDRKLESRASCDKIFVPYQPADHVFLSLVVSMTRDLCPKMTVLPAVILLWDPPSYNSPANRLLWRPQGECQSRRLHQSSPNTEGQSGYISSDDDELPLPFALTVNVAP